MAKKATLIDVEDTALNTNFSRINDALDNTVSRDGSTPNSMGADIDLNSNDILNAAAVYASSLYLNGSTVTGSTLYFDPTATPQAYGAKGDGVTDDTVAIQAAITGVGAGGTLYFPPGVYIVSDTDADGTILTQLSGQWWVGASANSSIIRVSSTASSYTRVVDTAASAENYGMMDLQIDGNRDNLTPTTNLYTTYRGIRGPSAGRNGTYKNLILSNHWGRTLETGQEGGTITERVSVDNVTVVNAGTKGILVMNTKKATVSNCYSEVDAYTAAENPAAATASSGSCFEVADSVDVTIANSHGIQVDDTVKGPGIRLINSSSSIKVFGNTIEDASYLGFIQNVNDVQFYSNTGRDIQGNAILIADADADEPTTGCTRIVVRDNTIIDPDDAFILIRANKDGYNVDVECYIHDNFFIQVTGTPTHGIYNGGVEAPATGGTCVVYEWDNHYEGTIPNHIAGVAPEEIKGKPNAGWEILEQSSVANAHTGDTNETTLATITVPGYAMGGNGRVRVTAVFSHDNSANNKITRVRWGGGQVYAATNTTTASQRLQAEIGNRNSLSSQVTAMPGGSDGWGLSTSALATFTQDTSSDVNITLTGALANSGETITLESYLVEIYKEV